VGSGGSLCGKKAVEPDTVLLFFVEQGLLEHKSLTEDTVKQLSLGKDFLVPKKCRLFGQLND